MTRPRTLRRLVVAWGLAGSWLGVLMAASGFVESVSGVLALFVSAAIGAFLLGGVPTATIAAAGRTPERRSLVLGWLVACTVGVSGASSLGYWFERSQVGPIMSFGLAGFAIGISLAGGVGGFVTGFLAGGSEAQRGSAAAACLVLSGVGFFVATFVGAVGAMYLITAGSRVLAFLNPTLGGFVGAGLGGFLGGTIAGVSLAPAVRGRG